ncbi:MAG: phosphopyruvate hydratase [Candidatus Micrarchaeota archaeon]|nr:phosphopyruvate hydratase [Candidatus Micrarchaeota archaeon]
MGKIKRILAREVLDSRGNPTVQVDVFSDSGFGRATAPSGASTGRHEAVELRDGGKRFLGRGVSKAVKNVNEIIAKALIGMEVCDQRAIDDVLCKLDGTPGKSRLGANATTAVSLAVAHCSASEKGVGLHKLLGKALLPAPMMNLLNGGKHAANGLAVQEFMVFPLFFPSFSSALRAGAEIYHSLASMILKKYGKGSTALGDEGGFAPQCKRTEEALALLESAIEECGYSKKVKLAIDAAASSFYDKKSRRYLIDGQQLSAQGLSDFYLDLVKSYPIASLEDPFEEESFEEFAFLKRRLAGKVQLVGDDLLVTNPARIRQAISKGSCSALLLKVNQIGTLSEALEAARLCQGSGMGVIVSHRSGESEDSSIADIAVGIGCGQIKAGAPARGERTAKYNRLLQIEEELPDGSFAKGSGLKF